jgi:hypothetical protein
MTSESRNSAVREAPRRGSLAGRGLRNYTFQISGCRVYVISGGTTEKTPLATVPLFLAYIPCVCVSVCISSIVARQQLSKHDPSARNIQATIEEIYITLFYEYIRSMPYQKKVTD